MSQVLVKDNYSIYDNVLIAKAGHSSYWKNVKKFWDSVKENPVGTLSERQRRWLEKIEEAMDE